MAAAQKKTADWDISGKKLRKSGGMKLTGLMSSRGSQTKGQWFQKVRTRQ